MKVYKPCHDRCCCIMLSRSVSELIICRYPGSLHSPCHMLNDYLLLVQALVMLFLCSGKTCRFLVSWLEFLILSLESHFLSFDTLNPHLSQYQRVMMDVFSWIFHNRAFFRVYEVFYGLLFHLCSLSPASWPYVASFPGIVALSPSSVLRSWNLLLSRINRRLHSTGKYLKSSSMLLILFTFLWIFYRARDASLNQRLKMPNISRYSALIDAKKES